MQQRLAPTPQTLKGKLDRLGCELASALKPVANKPYIVFHDALQYFERRFGLNDVGAISLSPEIPPGAKRLTQLREKIRTSGSVVCVRRTAIGRRACAIVD